MEYLKTHVAKGRLFNYLINPLFFNAQFCASQTISTHSWELSCVCFFLQIKCSQEVFENTDCH